MSFSVKRSFSSAHTTATIAAYVPTPITNPTAAEVKPTNNASSFIGAAFAHQPQLIALGAEHGGVDALHHRCEDEVIQGVDALLHGAFLPVPGGYGFSPRTFTSRVLITSGRRIECPVASTASMRIMNSHGSTSTVCGHACEMSRCPGACEEIGT